MEDSLFTKIIKGEIPCHKVYEDDKVLAFLDIAPFTEGHTLVVPKQQIDYLWNTDEELYQYLMAVARKVATRQREVLNPPRVGMLVDGFGVPHTHIHVFPMSGSIETTIHNKIQKPADDQLQFMATKLAF